MTGWQRLGTAVVLVSIFGTAASAAAQRGSVAAVPKLDLDRFLVAWNVQAWLPTKAQKKCAGDAAMLYAYGENRTSFTVNTFCRMPNASTGEWSASGKVDKAGGGKLRLKRLYFFSSPYWVLAVDPEYTWALVGTPNHKRLWVLTKGREADAQLLTELEGKAAAQGFEIEKLVAPPHTPQAK